MRTGDDAQILAHAEFFSGIPVREEGTPLKDFLSFSFLHIVEAMKYSGFFHLWVNDRQKLQKDHLTWEQREFWIWQSFWTRIFRSAWCRNTRDRNSRRIRWVARLQLG